MGGGRRGWGGGGLGFERCGIGGRGAGVSVEVLDQGRIGKEIA